jgi:hypothetical protein
MRLRLLQRMHARAQELGDMLQLEVDALDLSTLSFTDLYNIVAPETPMEQRRAILERASIKGAHWEMQFGHACVTG